MATIYDFKALNNKGAEVDFADFKGKVLLIVNTASKCGFTVVIGFPCDQFAHQEPGSDAEIAEFCRLNHGVTFPLMSKIEVNGEGAHPIYKYLKSETKGLLGSAIKWNFTKFLISRDGTKIERFAPMATPASLEDKIKALL